MAKCEYCGKEVALPFKCKYCGGYFCVDHHLPENHNCPGLQRGSWKPMIMPDRYSLEWQKATEIERKKLKVAKVDRKVLNKLMLTPSELKDITIAIIAVAAVYLLPFPLAFLSFKILIGIIGSVCLAFLLHEMAHKYVAIHYGYSAHFKLSIEGLAFTLLSLLLPIRVIAPGYVAILAYGRAYNTEYVGKIAVAGPITNIILGLIGLIAIKFAGFNLMAYQLAKINAEIALFNLIPLGVLDGRKVIEWSKEAWLTTFLTSFLLVVGLIFL